MTSDAEWLIEAMRTNDATLADTILGANAGFRAMLTRPLPHDPFGGTVLTQPASRGHMDMVDVLIRHGADINARSDWWAGSVGVLDVCDPTVAPALIQRGARVDVHAAARLGMLDLLTRLLDENPDLVHARGGDGQTPLHFAANVDIARELLVRGADINALDVDHESTPAQYMVRDRTDVARYLITRGARTDIFMASAVGALELVRKHLNANPELLNARVSKEFFPMRDRRAGGSIYIWTLGDNASPHSAARAFGHPDVYEYLMSQSPEDLQLVRGAECGDEALVRRLVSSGIKFSHITQSDYRRSIAVAASSGSTVAVRLMLEAGWPTDVRGQDGGTPLHWAAWLGNAEMVRDLAHHGAPLEDRGDTYRLTPLGWALHGSLNSWRKDEGDYGATVRALLEAGATQPDTSAKLDASEEALRGLTNFRTRQEGSGPPS